MVRIVEPVPRDPEPNEVIVQNLFAGSTHNVLHALLADPRSPFEWHRQPYHVLGSGAVCRVAACGREVDREGLFAPGQLAVNFPAVYRLLDARMAKPDLVVYIRANVEVLAARLRKRNRDFEQHISLGYLERVSAAFRDFFFYYDETPLLAVDTSEVDFVTNSDDLKDLIREIERAPQGVQHFVPRKR